MNTSTPSTIRLTSPDEIICAVPMLVGFHPTDSLVVLVLGDGAGAGVRLTARMDVAPLLEPGALVVALRDLLARVPGVSGVILVAFCEDPPGVLARCAGQAVHPAVPLVDLITTDGRRWWALGCRAAGCEGAHRLVDSSRVRAELVVAGLAALPDRATVERRYAGPASPSPRQVEAVRREVAGWDADRVRSRCLDLVDGGGGPPGDAPTTAAWQVDEPLELAVLVSDPEVARWLWWQTPTERARQWHQRWTDVVAAAPDEVALAPLVMCGLTAWLCGEGAAHVVCLERLDRFGDGAPLGDLVTAVRAIHDRVVPPQCWQGIAACRDLALASLAGPVGVVGGP